MFFEAKLSLQGKQQHLQDKKNCQVMMPINMPINTFSMPDCERT
jgi:hypothetical protein